MQEWTLQAVIYHSFTKLGVRSLLLFVLCDQRTSPFTWIWTEVEVEADDDGMEWPGWPLQSSVFTDHYFDWRVNRDLKRFLRDKLQGFNISWWFKWFLSLMCGFIFNNMLRTESLTECGRNYMDTTTASPSCLSPIVSESFPPPKFCHLVQFSDTLEPETYSSSPPLVDNKITDILECFCFDWLACYGVGQFGKRTLAISSSSVSSSSLTTTDAPWPLCVH